MGTSKFQSSRWSKSHRTGCDFCFFSTHQDFQKPSHLYTNDFPIGNEGFPFAKKMREATGNAAFPWMSGFRLRHIKFRDHLLILLCIYCSWCLLHSARVVYVLNPHSTPHTRAIERPGAFNALRTGANVAGTPKPKPGRSSIQPSIWLGGNSLERLKILLPDQGPIIKYAKCLYDFSSAISQVQRGWRRACGPAKQSHS